jgi:peptidoglycan hydrolase-like protein with peptidoglycan-binding domain
MTAKSTTSRHWPYLLGAVLILAAAAGAVAWLHHGARPSAQPARAATLPTAPITRGTLTETTQVEGTLGYAGAYSLIGYRAGTLTWLPATNTTLRRGQPVYHVNQRAIPLLYGEVPLYRPLATGSNGSDVAELERNLVALGYANRADLTVDSHYTDYTAAAVRRWQAALGVAQTGRIVPGDAVVAPGPIRVTATHGSVGQPAAPGQIVATATGTTRNVQVDLELADRSYAHTGERVTVELPSGRQLAGRITDIGTVATSTSDNNSQNSQPDETVPMEVTLTGNTSAVDDLDGAQINVDLVSERARDVLSVPVEALHVAQNGDFYVNVAGDHRRTVHTGLFTSGRVEVTGTGLRVGMRVEVPQI